MRGWARQVVETPCGPILEEAPPRLLSDHATRFMLDHLRVRPGDRAAEPGCGSGVLSLYLERAGATLVAGTDLDPEVLVAARHNAHLNACTRVRFVRGALLEAVAGPLDLIVALLPHKPGPRPFSSRFYGGPDGTDLLLPLVAQARSRLVPGGRLWLYLNSIADIGRVLGALEPDFAVSLRAEKRRYYQQAEMDALCPGLCDYWQSLQARGLIELGRDAAGHYFLARIYEASRR